jgi:putative endonuclease|tara:strand:- start:192 stop:398 length:207 start_codon:yes stop_codon:yes gene_type:complete
VWEHKNKAVKGFTKRYNMNKLVYFEEFGSSEEAIYRENQIKAGSRQKKIELIESINPDWKDLSEGFEY